MKSIFQRLSVNSSEVPSSLMFLGGLMVLPIVDHWFLLITRFTSVDAFFGLFVMVSVDPVGWGELDGWRLGLPDSVFMKEDVACVVPHSEISACFLLCLIFLLVSVLILLDWLEFRLKAVFEVLIFLVVLEINSVTINSTFKIELVFNY